MTETLVRSVNLSNRNDRQTVSWSLDDRLAVSADKDIFIMKLDVFRGGSTYTGPQAKMQAVFPSTRLAPRPNLWPKLHQHLQHSSREVNSEVRQRWTYSDLNTDQFTPCWTSLVWSPPGLAPNNRTVLAGVTSDHRLIITGLSKSGSPWVQLADLGDQLTAQYQQQRPPQTEEDSDDDMANVDSAQCSAAAMSAYIDMMGLAPIDVMWSHVMSRGNAEERCVLLFAVMKNGDIVTWNIAVPCTGIESCRIVDRQRTNVEGTVCSLAWTRVPDDPQCGVLAVGYTDGRVEALCYGVDPGGSADASPHCFTHSVHPDPDHLSASGLAWLTDTQGRLMLLTYKKNTLCAQVVSVDRHGNRGGSQEGEGSGGGRLEMGACGQVALGNGMGDARLAVAGDTVVLAVGDCVYHVAVTASSTEVGVGCVGEAVFHHPAEQPWGCVSVALSPNNALVMALFRPLFAYNHLNEHFRCPIKVHISPLTTDWDSLAVLISSLTVSKISTTLTDILQRACHTLLQTPVTTDTVTKVTHRLMASPYSDTPVGWRVARHLLSLMKSLCEDSELTDQVPTVTAAHQEMTDLLLCYQVSKVCQALDTTQSADNTIDESLLNMMLYWVTQSERRSEVIGSELVGRLRAVVGEPRTDTCVLCDNDMDLTNGIAAMCIDNHKFGLCCHTLAVCQSLTYQCCVTCGAISLSARQLKGLPWVGEDHNICTLCQCFLYSVNSSIRF